MVQQSLSHRNKLLLMLLVFLGAYGIPFDHPRVAAAIQEAFLMLSGYAREHVLFCIVPAMFIAGAITVFLNQKAMIRWLGPGAPKAVAYSIASISGTILAVCSCTVLPLFKGIYKKGAGLGPAISFLYSGPAVNILAIVLSYKVFGWKLGTARMIGAILFAVLIGLLMQALFRKEDEDRRANEQMFLYEQDIGGRTPQQMILYMGSMIGILVFVNWAPSRGTIALWDVLYRHKYVITGAFALLLLYTLLRWFSREELKDWTRETRDFSLQILPYLFGGVLAAGFLLGRPGHQALIPNEWVSRLLGGNSLGANFFASIAGACMYFATLTEVPIVQGLLGSGMGKGPALTLLLAGPSLSLPSMLVLYKELGIQKTFAYVLLVVGLSTLAGYGFGAIGGNL